jgi:hypothetical protein
MVSDLADEVGRIVPFVYKAQEQTMDDDVDLLNSVIRRLFDLAIDTAEFICGYVHRSPLSMSVTSEMTQIVMIEQGGRPNRSYLYKTERGLKN